MYFLETLQVRAPCCHAGVLYSFWYWWNVVCYAISNIQNKFGVQKNFGGQFFLISRTQVMGVCCIVFDIDGMNFLNKYFFFFKNFVFSISCFLRVSCYFPTSKTNLVYKKNLGGGGQFFLISRFMLFSTLQKILKSAPFTYWLNGRWFLQIVDGDSWNLYSYPPFPCSDFVSQMWGGGGCNVFSHFMLFPKFLEKTNLGIQNNYVSFKCFLCVFFMLEILKSAPSLTD